MSRLTKFLRQTCSVEKLKVNEDGSAVFDKYGNPEYEEAVTTRCRMEPSSELVQDSTGHMVRSTATYYVDNSVTLSVGDRINGKPIIKVDAYVVACGATIGWEAYV